MIDIATWLRQLGLERYEAVFRDNEISGAVLPELTEDDLKDLGLPLGPRKLLLRAITALVAASAAVETSSAAPATVRPREAALLDILSRYQQIDNRLYGKDIVLQALRAGQRYLTSGIERDDIVPDNSP